MKVFNISVMELLKNKLYFSYFALGLALLLAVIGVLANYSEQVFDGFFTQFNNGQILPLEVKELPRESQYYSELPIFAEGSGITYNITVSHGESSVYLPSYRGGLCVVSAGSIMLKELSLITGNSTELRFENGIVYPTRELAENLGCKKGDKILIDNSKYDVGDVILTSEMSYSFFIYDPDIITDEYTVILSNNNHLLDFTKYLNARNYSDT